MDETLVPWDQGAASVRMHVEQRMLDELATMTKDWSTSEAQTHYRAPMTPFSQTLMERTLRLHCHVGGGSSPIGEVRMPDGQSLRYAEDTLPFMFVSRKVRHGLCPAWLPDGEAETTHVSDREHFSEELMSVLAEARRRFPGVGFFERQLVRTLLSQDRALSVDSLLGPCTESTQCVALKGVAAYASGQWRIADSLFRRSLRMPSHAITCGWTSATELLPAPRKWTADRRCAGDAVDSTAWWLATPFWSEDVNHRWLAHVVRNVEWSLKSDLPRDVHWEVLDVAGGDIVRQLHLRYGDPTHVFNAGPEQDVSHRKFLQGRNSQRVPEPPYGAPEYDRRAQSMFPTATAIVAPLALRNYEFQLARPDSVRWTDWWPSEFFRHPNGSILNIADAQIALLRRNNYASMLVGAQMPGLADSAAGPATVSLLGRAPGGPLQVVDLREDARWGQGTVLTGTITQPLVLSLEALSGGRGVAGARYRWGVPMVPMTPNAGECALSEPLLLHDAPSEQTFEAVRQQVRSSTTMSRGSTTGLYWESYGFLASDSVDVQLIVESSQRSATSPLERERVVSMAWREPSAATALVPVTDHPTTLGRVMTLNLATLRRGAYRLRVTMRAPRCAEVSGTRAFQVQ